MTSDPKPLPIPTYDISGCSIGLPPYPVPMCKADDVRELVDRLEKAEAQRNRAVATLRALWCHGLRIDQMHIVETALAAIDKENA